MSNFLIPAPFNVRNSEHVYLLQQVLVLVLKDELGGEKTISAQEIAECSYENSTKEAVAYFQEKYGLIQTPGVSDETVNLLNTLSQTRYHIYGIINDDVSLPVEGIIPKLYHKLYGSETLLGEGVSLNDGSYRIYLTFKSSEEENEENESLTQLLENGVLKNPLCCVVKFFVEISKNEENEEIELFESDRFFINELKTRQDFFSEYFVYSGYSEYKLLKNRLAGNKINTEKSADDENDIEYLFEKNLSDIQKISSTTGIDTEILMRLIFAYELSEADTSLFKISTEVAFGYLIQNYPINMPIILYDETVNDWDNYKNEKRDFILAGLLLLTKDEHINILTNAITYRYISRLSKEEIESLVDNLLQYKYELLETLPLLEGNTTIGELGSIIRNVIVDDPSIWKTNDNYIKNMAVPLKTQSIEKSSVNTFGGLFDRDYEMTGGDNCWADKDGENTIVFHGNIAYTTQLNTEYKNRGLSRFGSYVGVIIRIPEGYDVNPFDFQCQITDDQNNERWIYYDELSQKEITEGYIHIYLNLSSLNPEEGDLPHEHHIYIYWGNYGSEDFYVQTHNVYLDPYSYPEGFGVVRDMLHVGGEYCDFHRYSDTEIGFEGDIEHNMAVWSLGRPMSGYYVGIAFMLPERNLESLMHYQEFRIMERRGLREDERVIPWDTLSKEEITGGFIHIYFDLHSAEGILEYVRINTSFGFGEYYMGTNYITSLLPPLQIYRDWENTGGSSCEAHCYDDRKVVFSGKVIYRRPPVEYYNEGNYVGIYLFPPFVPGGYIMSQVHCSSGHGDIDIRYAQLSEQEKEYNYIHVLINMERLHELGYEDWIYVNWGREYYISSGTELLHLGELPHVPIDSGYISRDREIGGANCQSVTSGNNRVSFSGQIDWLASKGGNYIAVNIFAPEGLYNLSHLRFKVRNEWFTYNNLSSAEKRDRRIHIYLGYSTVPANESIYVEWRYDLVENYYVSVQSGTILQGNPNPPVEQQDFEQWKHILTEIYTNNISSYKNFVKEIKNREEELYPAKVDKLITYFDVSRVVMNFTPFVENISKLSSVQQYGARALATFSKADYNNMLSQGEYPAIVPGNNEGEKRTNYIKIITDSAQKLYPDIYIVSEIEQKELAGFDKIGEIKELLLNHPEFDLLTDNIDKLKITDTAVNKQLVAIQDIYKITPDPVTTVAFISAGFKSAKDIYATGKEQVVNRFLGMVSQEAAEAAYKASTASVAEVLSAYTNISNTFNFSDFSAIKLKNQYRIIEKISQDTGIDEATLKELFGDSGSYCKCDHDSSVYSAAAYLKDLLYYLEHRGANKNTTDKSKVKDHLIKRRPDIELIQPNKQNTSTIMPYIDIVCEVLEENILQQIDPDYIRSEDQCQSTLPSKELLAAPEHILSNDGKTAYDILSEAVYPMYAPLNLYQTEIRVYLDMMGIQRHELMQAFQHTNNADIAAEYFGLTSYEQNIITQKEEISERNKAWRKNLGGSGEIEMPVVSFMEDSGLSIFETIDILNEKNGLIRWPNIALDSLLDCSYEDKNIVGSAKTFDKTHRFIRLWRNSGWKIWELDLLLRSGSLTGYVALSAGEDNLNDEALYHLMLFKQQQEALNLAAENLLALYQDINREILKKEGEEISCLYDRLFLNKSVSNPLNSKLITIKSNDTEVITDKEDTLVASCLSLKETDYLLLKKEWEGLPKNIKYLSYLYRNSVLAGKLKISIADLLSILRLMKNEGKINNLTSPYTLSVLSDIISMVNSIQDFEFSIAEYEYLVEYEDGSEDISEKAKTIALTTEQMDAFLKEIVPVFKRQLDPPTKAKIEGETGNFTATEEYKKTFTDYLLATDQFNNPDDIAFLIQCIERPSSKTDDEIKEFQKRFFPENTACYVKIDLSNITITKEELIKKYDNIAIYIDTSIQSVQLYNYVSAFYGLSTEITQLLLTSPINDNNFANRIQIALYYFWSNQPIIYFYPFLILIHKNALIIHNNLISYDEMSLLLDAQEKLNFDWMNFNLGNTLKFNGLLSLHRSYGTSTTEQTLLSIINDYPEETDTTEKQKEAEKNFYTALCQLSAWDYNQFYKQGDDDDNIAGILELEVSDFYEPDTYFRVTECLSIVSNVGVTVKTINNWKYRQGENNAEKNRCQEIKDTAKSHYTLNQWLDKLPEIQKPIREAKSDALASYLIAHSLRGNVKVRIEKDEDIEKTEVLIWENKNALYAYFLLDVEMSACMKISRIVQATSSVQLFVQRCFLSLEENVNVDESKDTRWAQWEWMKKYRLWEANRKVFLYPENYIEPELRDNKTLFFKELEDELAQGEITAENIEAAFENYLQKLNEVANLVVCGVYNEIVNDDDGVKLPDGRRVKASRKAVVHVIARSKSAPYQYYYRTYDVYTGEWKEWEKIDLDIQSDMVFPVVYNRRLHLFWLDITSKSFDYNARNDNTKEPYPIKYSEVQLVWSVLKHGKWTGINRSQRKTLSTPPNYHDKLINYSLMISHEKELNQLILKVFIGSCIEDVGYFVFDGEVQNVYYIVNSDENTYLIIFDNMDLDTRPSPIPKPKVNSLSTSTIMRMFANRRYTSSSMGSGTTDKSVKLLGSSENSSAFEILNTKTTEPNIITNLYNREKPLPVMSCISNSYVNSYFFYQDLERSFFVEPYKEYIENLYSATSFREWIPEGYSTEIEQGKQHRYFFRPFYHPYTKLFIKELSRAGIEGLLNRDIQLNPNSYYPLNTYDFESTYNPNEEYVTFDKDPVKGKGIDFLDFSYDGAYSMYNWELFFHVPLYLACKLSQDQKFEDAMRWFHYIFNPTTKEGGVSPQKFWITKMFYEMTTEENRAQQIEDVLNNIKKHAESVNTWLNNPYNPHAVARTRPVAYQRTVVMKYLDNLIAWADHLFRQDSIESNNEATLLYILAYEILGKRPVMLPEKQLQNNVKSKSSSVYNSFISAYNMSSSIPLANNNSLATIANAKVAVTGDILQKNLYLQSLNVSESLIDTSVPISAAVSVQHRLSILPTETKANNDIMPDIDFDTDNFCIPLNEDMLKYWDTIEDRLFKLRNCMNIEGVVRELPLFEPPIDPAMLVKAAAAGLSIGEALNDITAPQPYYRFRTILQKAVEYTSEVKQLGDKLLCALEKKDAETLNILRSTQEINLQNASVQVRKLQIDEAKENIENINALITSTAARKEYYESREYMNAKESTSYELGESAKKLEKTASTISTVAAGLSALPQFSMGGAGFSGSPLVSLSFGGQQIIASLNAAATGISSKARTMDKDASQLLTMAGYDRRKEEWDFQAKMASMELNQLETQLVAAEIRLMVAEKELENMQMQIEQSKSVLEYYKGKYTNEALYNWMITQVASVYFQSYKLAYDMAKKAEKCYRHELGIYETTNFIQFGYWDSLKKGLLSGERLMHDLHKLEASYLDKNKRTLELTKHISLAQMFPDVLLQLIASAGSGVTLILPEWIFDMDYPGHYMRRIKSVSITIPNVAGPYTNISFMLSLQSAKIRKSTGGTTYNEADTGNDSRFVYQTGGRESICTSSAQNDSGMFELNFSDERYLPFENAGVISTWSLSFPAGCNQFDLSTISDVILHINYTALYDGNLATKAKEELKGKLPEAGLLLFSPKNDFPDAWNQMDNGNKAMSFEIKHENLPFFMRGRENVEINNISVVLSIKKEKMPDGNVSFDIKKEDASIFESSKEAVPVSQDQEGGIVLYELHESMKKIDVVSKNWELKFMDDSFNASIIEDILICFKLKSDQN